MGSWNNRLLLFLFLGWQGIAFAQLQWDKRELEFRPTATDTNVVARFTFSNAGNYPVTILSTKISCGSCTLAGSARILSQICFGW